MKKRLLQILLWGFVFFNPLFFTGARATDTYVWIGGFSNNWEDEENWRNMDTQVNGELPVDDSDIMIDGNVTVYLSSAIITESIQLSGGATLIINAGGSVTTTEGGLNGSNSIRLDAASPYPTIQNPNPLYLPYLTGTGSSALVVYGVLNLNNDNASGSGLYVAGGSSVTIANSGAAYISNNGTSDEAIQVRGGSSLANNGTITITNPGYAGISTTSGGSQYLIVNNGTLTISGGVIGLDLGSTWMRNNGTVIVSGTSDKILSGDGNFWNFGTFGGNGIVEADGFISASGSTISPGASPGALTFENGNNSLNLAGVTLQIEINGTTPGSQYDQIVASGAGAVTMNSTTTVSLSGTYTPVSGNSFTFVSGSNVSGTPGGGPFILNNVELVQTSSGTLSFSQAFPVELTAFTARPKGRAVQLNWATATESNNDYFSIEHSADGRQFDELGRVDGAGNSLKPKQYSFVHSSPEKGLNYYRLKQYDFDGAFEYSKVQTAVIEGRPALTIRPTIARDEATIEWPEAHEGKRTIDIFNLAGQNVYHQNVPARLATTQLPLGGLSPGIYWVLARDNGEVMAERLVKE